jgi:hypothetical protein
METKVKLPKKLKVGGIIYKVLYPYLFIEDTSIVGLHEPSTAIIKIAGVNDSKFLCAERILETFLHESVHAIDYVYCNEQYNEDDVEAISKALFALLYDNDLKLNTDYIPEKVKIGGFVHNVTYPYIFRDVAEESVVRADSNTLKIFIADSDDVGKFDFRYVKKHFLSMLYTIIGYIYCIKAIRNSEYDCRMSFVSGLYQVLVDNKICELVNKYCKESG